MFSLLIQNNAAINLHTIVSKVLQLKTFYKSCRLHIGAPPFRGSKAGQTASGTNKITCSGKKALKTFYRREQILHSPRRGKQTKQPDKTSIHQFGCCSVHGNPPGRPPPPPPPLCRASVLTPERAAASRSTAARADCETRLRVGGGGTPAGGREMLNVL